MVATHAVRDLIREGKTFELPNIMQLAAKDGMQTLNQTLTDLVRRGIVTQEEAVMKSSNPEGLKKSLQFGYGTSKL